VEHRVAGQLRHAKRGVIGCRAAFQDGGEKGAGCAYLTGVRGEYLLSRSAREEGDGGIGWRHLKASRCWVFGWPGQATAVAGVAGAAWPDLMTSVACRGYAAEQIHALRSDGAGCVTDGCWT
jgi:hypothetical protein